MKKMTTLFRVDYHKKGDPGVIYPEVNEENAWVFTDKENVTATVKFDGTAAMIKEGVLYRRYDAKKGKVPPEDAIPCQPEPDPISMHWPHWVPVSVTNPNDRYFIDVINSDGYNRLEDGTYELCGESVQSNPEKIDGHKLLKHGSQLVEIDSWTFEGMRDYLSKSENDIEGIVFHHKDGRMCKIRKSDYGFKRGNINE